MEQTPSPKFPLVFIGFMGSGKSVVGWQVARRLGVRFRDLDQELEQAAGCPIPEFFQTAGEAEFRRREADALKEILADGKPAVVATGGGVVTLARNRKRLLAHGTCIFLDPPFPALLARIRLAGPGRPLADARTDPELETLWQRRRPWYQEVAELTISRPGPIETLVEEVLRRLPAG